MASQNIINLLVSNYGLDTEVVDTLRVEAESAEKPLEELLIENELITGTQFTLVNAEFMEMTPLSLKHFSPDAELLENMPLETLARYQMLPIAKCNNTLTVAMTDPFNVMAIEELSGHTGLSIVSVVASPKEIGAQLEHFASQGASDLEEILQDVSDGDVEFQMERSDDLDIDQMAESADDKPVIRVVNSILVESMRKGASDIHIEPEEKGMRVRYRVDGMLYESASPPKSMLSPMVSRIKIMSNLDIAERRIPQDGRFKVRALNKAIDVRVSILPTIHGEKVVMRLLDKSNLPGNVASLGLDESSHQKLTHALRQPYGMIFVTGPTGSGKTTTLYSALAELNQPGVNIITVEDPVEYQLKGINQVQTHADVGLTFSSGLRSILRQDPDILMVGEVRDLETASIAVQAALTGHLVLSTLHTNDAVGAVVRLKNMGIEPFLLASSLNLTQAQRLFRTLCPHCKREREVPLEILEKNRVDVNAIDFSEATFFEPAGCPKCFDIGYKGRAALMEIMEVDDDIRNLILEDAPSNILGEAAVNHGMTTLRQAGVQKAMQGMTTIEEIIRVTSSI